MRVEVGHSICGMPYITINFFPGVNRLFSISASSRIPWLSSGLLLLRIQLGPDGHFGHFGPHGHFGRAGVNWSDGSAVRRSSESS